MKVMEYSLKKSHGSFRLYHHKVTQVLYKTLHAIKGFMAE